MALIVNCFGAPGSGKSTGAAYIFSRLKMRGINCELVTEVAKDAVWDEAKAPFMPDNQLYMLGQQFYRMRRVSDKVDVVVTDSPILLSAVYNKSTLLGEEFNALVRRVFGSFENANFVFDRVKKYNPVGRLQTEEESDKLHVKIITELETAGAAFEIFPGCERAYEEIAGHISDIFDGNLAPAVEQMTFFDRRFEEAVRAADSHIYIE